MVWPHGGDLETYREKYGKHPLDFSANISPLGTPAGVQAATKAAVEQAALYPDPFCRELRRAISEQLGVPAEWVLCGNGASDLLWRLPALHPGRALLPVPGFCEYEMVLRRAGCRIDFYGLQEQRDFRLNWDILDRITEETDLLLLCEPNNPSGRTTEPALLVEILKRCRRTGTLLVVDECFLSFLERPQEHTLLPLLEEYRENLLILRAFTKFYGMAGLRLGYLICASRAKREALEQAGMPWAVSGPAQAAGIAALKETGYADRLRRMVAEQRDLLQKELTELGFRVIPGEANFLLFFSEYPDLDGKLGRRGILIRSCENFRGLSPGWCRIAVRTEEENRKLLQALGQIGGERHGEMHYGTGDNVRRREKPSGHRPVPDFPAGRIPGGSV